MQTITMQERERSEVWLALAAMLLDAGEARLALVGDERAAGGGNGERFDLVTFSWRDPEPRLGAGRRSIELGEPSWQGFDRASVETLLGVALEP